jgi:Protein of unknown function (DUF3307)
MSWSAALLALLVSHVVGDVLLQTDWQALNKVRGLGDPVARRALIQHVVLYTLAFIPALIWIGSNTSAGRAVAVAALVAIPHLVIDDGHVVRAWLRDVKGADEPTLGLSIAVDQSFHLLCLVGAALVAAA